MPEFFFHISSGEITNKRTVRKAFESLDDGSYRAKIESAKKRTLSQNAYYFAVVVPMVKEGLQESGFDQVRTNDDAHLVLKALFLKRHFVNPNTGEAIEWIESTAKLKTVDFNSYLESIWKWGAEYLGIQIPQPNEQLHI